MQSARYEGEGFDAIAVMFYRKALRHTSNAELFTSLGRCLFRLGCIPEAQCCAVAALGFDLTPSKHLLDLQSACCGNLGLKVIETSVCEKTSIHDPGVQQGAFVAVLRLSSQCFGRQWHKRSSFHPLIAQCWQR